VAYATLTAVDRSLDAGCYRCHVTGAFHADGPTSPTAAQAFPNVQCEACHGPSADHASEPLLHKPVKTPELSTCTECHDKAQDMGRFEAKIYWPKVVHRDPSGKTDEEALP
jgi:hypothetical protein